ncbi:MAG: hypothetical protein HY920_07795 [Elusimicrobia bacterium]|nr:hypothetical protein [Elusimicrobiota bacterium]
MEYVDLDYSRQSNRKTKEGANHPDRDKQFAYINNEVKKFQGKKWAVISVATKKKAIIKTGVENIARRVTRKKLQV